jgi:hypothetical protein
MKHVPKNRAPAVVGVVASVEVAVGAGAVESVIAGK